MIERRQFRVKSVQQLEFSDRVSVSSSELEELADFARLTVIAAGKAALPYFRQNARVSNKSDTGFDPVTQADRDVESAIRSAVERAYPAHGIYGEEFGQRGGNGLTWVVDPIDGTRAFMSGMLHWGVLLGLFDGEDVIVGAVYQPYVDELFIGYGGNAWHIRGGKKVLLRASACSDPGHAVLATTGPEWYTHENQAQFARLQGAAKMTRFGGDCYVHAMVASGGVDIGIDPGLKAYDIQALIPIVRGAGG